MLHIDPWPNRQSEILWTGSSCVNKRKQARVWSEVVGVMKGIYEDAAWGFRSVGDCWRSVRQCQLAVTESVPLGQPRSRSALRRLEDNTALYGQDMKKLWVNIAVISSFSERLLHTTHRNFNSFREQSVTVNLPQRIFTHCQCIRDGLIAIKSNQIETNFLSLSLSIYIYI